MCPNSLLTPLQVELAEKLLKEILFLKVPIVNRNLTVKRIIIIWHMFLSQIYCNLQGQGCFHLPEASAAAGQSSRGGDGEGARATALGGATCT